MGDHSGAEINLELDIADFSGKTVKRIDIENVVSRADAHKGGIAIVISFTDGATGTILVRSKEIPVVVTPYSRPRMADYSIVAEDGVVQVP
jgi:hypothetical protein